MISIFLNIFSDPKQKLTRLFPLFSLIRTRKYLGGTYVLQELLAYTYRSSVSVNGAYQLAPRPKSPGHVIRLKE